MRNPAYKSDHKDKAGRSIPMEDASSSASRNIDDNADLTKRKFQEESAQDDRLSDDLSNEDEEKQLEERLDEFDEEEEVQADLQMPPGASGMAHRTSVRPRKSRFLAKLPFFRRAKKSRKPAKPPVKYRRLFQFADKWDILLMIIGTMAAIGAGILFPIMLTLYKGVTNSLVDFGTNQTNTTSSNATNSSGCSSTSSSSSSSGNLSPAQSIRQRVKYYIILGFVSIFCFYLAWCTWMIAAERQVRRMRYRLFRNILRQEIGWFDVHNAGELSSRLIEDLDKIKDGINEKVPDFIALCCRMLGGLIYALITGWKLTLVFLSISPLIVIMSNMTMRTIVRFTIKEIQAFASASSIAQEVLQNVRTVTAFHGQAKEEERFAKSLIRGKQIGFKKGLYMGICQGLTQLLQFSAFAVTFWYGPQLVRTECNNYSAGSVIVIFVACMIATASTGQILPNLQNFAEAAGSASYVFEVIDRQTEIDATSEEGDCPKKVTGDIEFEDVTFTYPARQEAPILNKLSLKISSGKTVALVGASGCGKSTIIQLIQRLYDPEQGRVLLDGKDLRSLNVTWLRSQIGIVSQEPVLFTGSIEENIRFGKEDATDEEVENAAKMANAHDFIMDLPDNYKTTSGDKLSGGQKQRVAIARALVSNPRILLLDEATSALDNTSERIVQKALDRAKEGRTTIVVAHRLSTIQNADLIIGLQSGEVVEHGTHDELMNEKGLYYELVTTQTEKQEEHDENEKDLDEAEVEFVRRQSTQRHTSKTSNRTTHSLDTQEDDDELLSEDSDDEPGKKKKKRFFRIPFIFKMLKYNVPEWHWILLGVISSLIYGAIQPLFALFFSNIYGLFADPDLNEQEHQVGIYAGIIFLAGVGGGVTQFLCTFSFGRSGDELTLRMRKMTFAALLRQEISYFDYETNSVGALVTRLSADSTAVKGLTGVRIGLILQTISTVVTALVIAFLAGWKLALVILCFAPLMTFSGKLQGQRQGKAGQTKEKGSFPEQAGQHATQAIEQIRTVVCLRQEKHFIDLYEHAFNQDFRKQMCQIQLVALGSGLGNSLMYFIQCVSFGYGSQLIENGEMAYSNVFRVFVVITFAMVSVGRSLAMVPDYSKGKKAASRILKLNQRPSEIDPQQESGTILDHVVGNVEFRDVRFRYPSRPTLRILKDFSLECSSGITTALVGPSGSGKSTSVALLQRFYDPLKGQILLDGHDIKQLNVKWLRSLMGLVQQEPVLFNLSIRENIAYGDNSREVPQEEIEKVAKMANIHELIVSLPKGYDTPCGAKGSQLSGGQKQRIAIARALVRSPKILLLDEATSALDNKSEKVVQAALDTARSGRTCLIIAHRLSTIQKCEKIAVVDRGRVKEEGTHAELLELGGIYQKLAVSQQQEH